MILPPRINMVVITEEMRARVARGFEGFIGQDEAMRMITRGLLIAMTHDVPTMDKTLLLLGPPSTGKTDMSLRMAKTLGLPFVRLDGRSLISREKLFEAIDDALAEKMLHAVEDGLQSGMRVLKYPQLFVFVDEIHMASVTVQEGFLTMLEGSDRTVVLGARSAGRRTLAVVKQTTFVFATTKPTHLDKAFRSRCMEVTLNSYSLAEVTRMVRTRYPHLSDSAAEKIAGASRLTPRRAFDLAREVVEEMAVSGDDIDTCIRTVARGMGILFANGISKQDLEYLKLIKAQDGRPVGINAISSMLLSASREEIEDDIEPFLIRKALIKLGAKGRELTHTGSDFLRRPEVVEKISAQLADELT